MRSISGPFGLHNCNAVFYLLIGQVQAEFATQYIPEFTRACEPAFLSVAVRIPHRDARIVHRDPALVWPGLRRDDIALVRRRRVRRGIPVRDFVFRILARVRDHAIDVVPIVMEPRLEGQFAVNICKPHQFMGGLLLDLRRKQDG